MKDASGEVYGRNRELLILTRSASETTRSLFRSYIDKLAKLEIEGELGSDSARLESLRCELQSASEIACAEAESKLQGLLKGTSRHWATELASMRSLPNGPAYSRFAWILGVAGTDNANLGSLREYLLGAATWYSESLIRLIATSYESNLLAIDPHARHGRMEAGSTRFRWVCELFAEAIDAWATERGGRCADLFGKGRTKAFAYATSSSLPLPVESSLELLHPDVRAALIAPVSPGAAVASLIEGNGAETQPLIEIDGHAFIGNASALALSEETVLMSAIKSTLGSKEQGDAFEYACHFIATRLLPPSIHVARDSFVSDTMTSSKGDEIDIHLYAKRLHVIVEAKSHLPAKDAASAANSFSELLKASHQVDHRVSRLRDGKWIRRGRTERTDHVSGLVVALHDYTSQMWRPESMLESGVEAFIAVDDV